VKNVLIEKIKNKEAVVGIVGLGYVGLPLLLRFAECGFGVIGFDIDPHKIQSLVEGRSYIKHIPREIVTRIMRECRVNVTTDFSQIKNVDAIILCVPTPLGKHNDPDLTFVVNTTEALLPHLRKGQIVSLESTTYPGTTDEELRPRLEKRGFNIGKDMFLVFSPEREDPGNPGFTTNTIPKVLGGVTSTCTEVGSALYGQAIDHVVQVSSTKVAEMAKLLENIYRAVNIGLVNEMKMVADRMGIDIWEVIEAASTKPFGFVPFYPGPGLGGHCIPIDPFYLTWKAKEYGLHTRFIELAGEVNTGMPDWVVDKVVSALNDKGKALRGARVLVLGAAYKKNIDDMRESPSVELIERLKMKGAEVDYSDPHVPKLPAMRKYQFDMASVELSAEKIATYDCILIATDHDAFDYEVIKKAAQLVVDTRGVYRESFSGLVKA